MNRIIHFPLAIVLLYLFPLCFYGQSQSLDNLIDEGFAPVSKAISKAIFYAPRLADDILYGEVGVPQASPDFYASPPIELRYSRANNRIPYGERITISYASADSFLLTGTLFGKKGKARLPYDQEVTVEGFKFSLHQYADSAYPIEPGRAYYAQPEQVHFLPLVLVLLVLGMIFFSFYFGFINFTRLPLAFKIVQGKFDSPSRNGEVSHFQALATALAGTIGLGNIAGVAIAVSIGGAGATLWMILLAILGMAAKFTEATLAVKYRHIGIGGIVSGGPMYYLSEGFKNRGWEKPGKVLAVFFAVMCIGSSLGVGNMFQVNQACQQLITVSGGAGSLFDQHAWAFGLLMAAAVALVIVGGIRRIAILTDKLVPLMCGLYILGALWVIISHIADLPAVFQEILSEAFAPMSVAGGIVGVLLQGFSRATFSSEVGLGTAAIVHATTQTRNPASQGIVAMLGPLVDTVVLCSLTALVIIISKQHLEPHATDGIALTAAAFSASIPFAAIGLAVMAILFAFSSLISWSYYGLKAWTFLWGNKEWAPYVYQALFCLFIIVGAAASLRSIIDFSYAMMFAMAIPNMIGLVLLAPEVREELSKYIRKIQRGELGG